MSTFDAAFIREGHAANEEEQERLAGLLIQHGARQIDQLPPIASDRKMPDLIRIAALDVYVQTKGAQALPWLTDWNTGDDSEVILSVVFAWQDHISAGLKASGATPTRGAIPPRWGEAEPVEWRTRASQHPSAAIRFLASLSD